jgi:glycosyltransferase involved in cell wall biosynthesis
LYGAGDHENYIRELVEHYKLSKHVLFCGVTNDIRSIWKEHHMLILASRLEGTPLVLMESMLCGRPAIVTNVGGNADWVLNLENGFLALAANVDLLNYSLEEAWTNQDKWQEMGKNAREFFLANHEVSSGETLLKVLQQTAR